MDTPANPQAPSPENQNITDEYRERVYNLLADCLVKALQNPNPEVLSMEDSEQSAEFVLQHLEQVKTKDELYLFLKQLSERWFIYHPVYEELQKEDLMQKVQSELQRLQKVTL